MPMQNKRDIEDFPEVLRNEITFIPVENIDEVFEIVFGGQTSDAKPKKKRAPKAKTMPVEPQIPSQNSIRC